MSAFEGKADIIREKADGGFFHFQNTRARYSWGAVAGDTTTYGFRHKSMNRKIAVSKEESDLFGSVFVFSRD